MTSLKCAKFYIQFASGLRLVADIYSNASNIANIIASTTLDVILKSKYTDKYEMVFVTLLKLYLHSPYHI